MPKSLLSFLMLAVTFVVIGAALAYGTKVGKGLNL